MKDKMKDKETLRVERGNKAWGWAIIHSASGNTLLERGLRLRRFAEAARDELLATGVDWGKAADQLTEEDRLRSIDTWRRWTSRTRATHLDPETGEWYRVHATTRLLATPDGSFSNWGPPNPKQAAEYRVRRAAA